MSSIWVQWKNPIVPWVAGNITKNELDRPQATDPAAVPVHAVVVRKPPQQEILSSVVIALASAAMVALYATEINGSINKLYEYIDKQTAYAEWYHAHYRDVTHPREIEILDFALGLPVTAPDYSTHGKWGQIGERHENAVKRGEEVMLGAYGLGGFGSCDHQLDGTGEMVGADASFIEARVGERREERMAEIKADAISSVSPYTDRDPSNIFKYISNAIDLRTSVLNQAIGGFNGALGSLGYSIGRLAVAARQRPNSQSAAPSSEGSGLGVYDGI